VQAHLAAGPVAPFVGVQAREQGPGGNQAVAQAGEQRHNDYVTSRAFWLQVLL